MKIFVTGGSGFIGTNFVNLALKDGHKIFNIDNLKLFKKDWNLKHENYQFKKLNILNDKKILELLEYFKPDRLINFAAETHVDDSISKSDIFVKTNILGIYSLLKASMDYVKKQKKNHKFIFHQVSTDEVFGSLKLEENENKFNEGSLYNPSSPYSSSKASADLLLKSWSKTYDLSYNITYCSNNYGPFQHPSKFIPTVIIKNILERKIPIYGDGMNVRDWLYVEDHAKALLKIIKFNKVNEAYIIGGNNELNNMKTANLICNDFNSKRDDFFDHHSLIQLVEDRKGHDERYGVNTNKMQKELNWFPEEKFSTGLKKTIEWYKLNTKWWKRLYNE